VANSEISYRTLGHTGERVSCIGLGGFHLGKPTLPEKDAIALMHQAMDRGINFLDNSWDYNEGESERRMGRALKQDGYRKKAFLMTKIDGRTKDSAAAQLEESLRRLDTDVIDLVQFHEVIRFEDPDRIFAPQGAIEAMLEARQAGKVRYIGFTGHKDPRIHLYTLEVAEKYGFQFDAVQMPVNVMDAHYRSFGNLVLPELVKRKIGVLAMKSLGDSVILKSKLVTPRECLHYTLKTDSSVVIVGIDQQDYLDQAIEAAQSVDQVSDQEIQKILEKTKKAALTGDWELFKTSSAFDATTRNLEWLGGKSPQEEAYAPI
jgi:uncharacterized protein